MSLLELQYSVVNAVNPAIPVKFVIFLEEILRLVRVLAGGSKLLQTSIQVGQTFLMASAKLGSGMKPSHKGGVGIKLPAAL